MSVTVRVSEGSIVSLALPSTVIDLIVLETSTVYVPEYTVNEVFAKTASEKPDSLSLKIVVFEFDRFISRRSSK